MKDWYTFYIIFYHIPCVVDVPTHFIWNKQSKKLHIYMYIWWRNYLNFIFCDFNIYNRFLWKFRFFFILWSNMRSDTIKFIFVRAINFWLYHIHVDHIVTPRPISFRFLLWKLNDLENIKCELRRQLSPYLYYMAVSLDDLLGNMILNV